MKDVIGKEFIHSTYVKTDTFDAVVIKEHSHLKDGTVVPTISTIKSPKRSFWITKKGRQNHQFKKEYEDMENLDKFTVDNFYLELEIAKKLRGYIPNRIPRKNELSDSQFLYGSDIDVEALIKYKYQQDFAKTGLKATKITTGFLDTECSILEGNFDELLCISITHEEKVYTAILKSFFKEVDKDGNYRDAELKDLIALSEATFKEYIDRYKFKFEYFIGDKPIDLIIWIFNKINENKTDFMGIWNMLFDMRLILNIIKEAGLRPEDIMCPAEVPDDIKYTRLVEDKKPVDHFTKKWHWLYNTGHVQILDSTCLYSVLRTVIGKEPSYKLNDILIKNIGTGKLHFKNSIPEDLGDGTDWHRYMQTYRRLEYIVYNQFDVMSLQIMEWKNGDITQMYNLIGVSHLSKYTRQTKRYSDALHFYCLDRKKVIGTVGTNMVTEFDKMVVKTGGAVVPPERTDGIGLKLFSDAPHIETSMVAFASDIDFTGMYPTLEIAMNISKETKLATAINIENCSYKVTQQYFSLIISMQENAVQICNMYYGLPSYTEFLNIYKNK